MSLRWTEDQLLAYQLKAQLRNDQSSANMPVVVDDHPEKVLQDRAEEYCRENGYYAFHDRSRGQNPAGFPDLVIALPKGRTVWIEFKSKHGRLSGEQKTVRLQLMALGHEWYEIRSFRHFLSVLQEKRLHEP